MPSARTFSWTATALGAGVINLLINAPLGWAVVKPGTAITLWGIPGIAMDMVLMAFGLAFGTALVVTLQTRRQFARGMLLAPALSVRWRNSLAGWPRSTLQRAINVGVLGVLLFVPLPLFGLWLFGVESADRLTFTAFKGAFSFVEGSIVTPIVAVAAMLGQPAGNAAPSSDNQSLS